MENTSFFGAKAKIQIKYNGDIITLGKTLSKALIINDFSIENREEPPYDLVGSCEAFGFEIWLENLQDSITYNYLLTAETEMSLSALVSGQMHDLSGWLTNYVRQICKLDCVCVSTPTGAD